MKKYYATYLDINDMSRTAMFKAADFSSAMALAQVYIWAVNTEHDYTNPYKLTDLTTTPKRGTSYVEPMGE